MLATAWARLLFQQGGNTSRDTHTYFMWVAGKRTKTFLVCWKLTPYQVSVEMCASFFPGARTGVCQERSRAWDCLETLSSLIQTRTESCLMCIAAHSHLCFLLCTKGSVYHPWKQWLAEFRSWRRKCAHFPKL